MREIAYQAWPTRMLLLYPRCKPQRASEVGESFALVRLAWRVLAGIGRALAGPESGLDLDCVVHHEKCSGIAVRGST